MYRCIVCQLLLQKETYQQRMIAMTAPSQLYKFVYIDNLINRSVEIQLNGNRETMTRISYPIGREKDMYFFLGHCTTCLHMK